MDWMGELNSYVRKVMSEKGLSQTDLIKKSDGALAQSQLAAIARGNVLQSREPLELLAKALDVPANELFDRAARDLIKKKFKLDLCIKGLSEPGQTYKLPLFEVEELPNMLNSKGYPEGKFTRFIERCLNHGSYAYAVYIKDYILLPRVRPGEIIVISQDMKPDPLEDECIIGISKSSSVLSGQILLGRGRVYRISMISFETLDRRIKEVLDTSEINFMHPIVDIFRLPDKALIEMDKLTEEAPLPRKRKSLRKS